jgi:hypothetical protein
MVPSWGTAAALDKDRDLDAWRADHVRAPLGAVFQLQFNSLPWAICIVYVLVFIGTAIVIAL